MNTTVEKAQRYEELRAEIAAVIDGESDRTARLASAASLLAHAFPERFFWTGFYMVAPDKPRELVVGPYQGTLGCLRIPFDNGVCGACAREQRTIIVPDVHAFPGHIACDSRSNSEIVVPLIDKQGVLIGVLDVDSTLYGAFDETDARCLEAICAILA